VQAATTGKTHVVTMLYLSPALHVLDGAARAAGIVVLNEAGLDPGIDHLPNRDSVPFCALFRIPEAHTVVRGTPQYVSFAAFMAVLGKTG
jgi:saccharopine dehydrogenase-like NADP-dependent oxidoreductase